jgi:hypothetical protein
MSELAVLEKRRELVELSANLQRATISRRLSNIESRKGPALLGMLATLGTAIGARPGVRKVALAGALMVFRAWRRRRARH